MSEIVINQQLEFERSSDLIRMLVRRLEQSPASKLVEAVTNPDNLVEMMVEANRTGKTLVFNAIGCVDWKKPDWGNPEVDRLVGNLTTENKRAIRFAQELADFQKSLASFGIDSRINLSLSNVELAMHVELGNMGQTIHTHQPLEVARESLETLADMIERNGGYIEVFDHLASVQQIMGETNLGRLQNILAAGREVTFNAVLDGLFEFDFGTLHHSLIGEDELGPVILDIQSFAFEEQALASRETANQVSPETPILTLFRNAGNWGAATSLQSRFLTKEQIISKELGVSEDLNPGQWAIALLSQPDDKLAVMLQELGFGEYPITNIEQKRGAVQLLTLLTHGSDPTQELEQPPIPSITLEGPTTVLDLVREVTGQNGKAVKNLLKEGSIRVDGKPISDPRHQISTSVKLQTGRHKVVNVVIE